MMYDESSSNDDDETNGANGAIIAPQEPSPIQPTPTTTTQNKYDDWKGGANPPQSKLLNLNNMININIGIQ